MNGEFYAGEMVAAGFKFPKTMEDVERLYPIGCKIRVRYKPTHPDLSVAIPFEVPPSSVYFPPRDDPRA